MTQFQEGDIVQVNRPYSWLGKTDGEYVIEKNGGATIKAGGVQVINWKHADVFLVRAIGGDDRGRQEYCTEHQMTLVRRHHRASYSGTLPPI